MSFRGYFKVYGVFLWDVMEVMLFFLKNGECIIWGIVCNFGKWMSEFLKLGV